MIMKTFAVWIHNERFGTQNLDCGGKRSATPLLNGPDVSAKNLIFARPKALSPLRSASAVQKASRTALFAAALFAASLAAAETQTTFKFDFGGGKGVAGATPISATNIYSAETGYGFEPGANVAAENQAITSTNPFYFSVKLPEGNYKVWVLLGDKTGESTTTVKAELRRLMLEKIRTTPDKSEDRWFVVNLRTPKISDSNAVHLKPREKTSEIWDWDEKLTLEFNGTRPCIAGLRIEKADVPTVFLLGDSTVCDQPAEPWNSWGQMLPRFFKPEIAIANHAESGETVADSLRAQRFAKVFSLMKPGDYLFVQFGHNDMKNHATNALDVYKADLIKVVARTRELGGTPVLVTSMERKSGVEQDTLAGYPQTVREVAKEENCALIDLHAMSRTFYRALGADLGQAFQDGTHHNNYGSYELAKCVVESIKQDKLPLAKSIVNDFDDFDPAKPDAVATFEMPASPMASKEKPLGN
jgi:lysophospholipase L1-like esterase